MKTEDYVKDKKNELFLEKYPFLKGLRRFENYSVDVIDFDLLTTGKIFEYPKTHYCDKRIGTYDSKAMLLDENGRKVIGLFEDLPSSGGNFWLNLIGLNTVYFSTIESALEHLAVHTPTTKIRYVLVCHRQDLFLYISPDGNDVRSWLTNKYEELNKMAKSQLIKETNKLGTCS